MSEVVVDGLSVFKTFLTSDEQANAMRAIDAGSWSTVLKRRVQHFGYRYDYTTRAITSASEAGPLPEWVGRIVQRMLTVGATHHEFDQLIVNEYLPGQGIAAHVDSVLHFEDEVASISLGSLCVMTFSVSVRGEEREHHVLLEPGDLLVMRGAARYDWRHRIRPRKSDTWEGRTIRRERRISLTFRKIRRQTS